MPKFYTSVILLINQSKEFGEKQFLVFGSRGGQISPLMDVPLYSHLLVQLIHSIKLILFYEGDDLFPMNEMDLIFNRNINFFLSIIFFSDGLNVEKG